MSSVRVCLRSFVFLRLFSYWIESALKLGMVNTSKGIMFDPLPPGESILGIPSQLRFPAPDRHSFAMVAPSILQPGSRNDPLVEPEDRAIVSEYLYFLMSQARRVYLTESERIGQRKKLEVGTPGLGCSHCYATHRKGMSRFYPAKRYLLPSKMTTLHEHLKRCSLCPPAIKARLAVLEAIEESKSSDDNNFDVFFNRVWARLHGDIPSGVSSDCRPRDSEMYK